MSDSAVSFNAIERKYQIRGFKDRLAGRKSRYEALKVEGCPYAEIYQANYEWDRELNIELDALRRKKPS